MDYTYFISGLENSAKKIKIILDGVTEEQAKWKPAPEKWSILEVVNHLYDEEISDFRQRLDLTLHSPNESWPEIDPQTWAISREYNKKDYHQSVHMFFSEREKSMKWLHSLSKPDWEQVHEHPILGPLSAADLLAAWSAHDYLHLRQLANLQAQFLNVLAKPHSTKYASP